MLVRRHDRDRRRTGRAIPTISCSTAPLSEGSIRGHRHRAAAGSRRGDLPGRRRCELSLAKVRRLWLGLDEHELVLGRPAAVRQRKWLLHKTRAAASSGGSDRLSPGVSFARGRHDRPADLARTPPPQRLSMERGGSAGPDAAVASTSHPDRGPAPVAPSAAEAHPASQETPTPAVSSGPRAPNYLTRIRDFVRGSRTIFLKLI